MLQTYSKKRDFSKTPEPSGKEKPGRSQLKSVGKALTFVIQKHSASHLHYDFRLECDGVLLSWAVPKGPSLDPAVKRLALMVEDHPLSYGDFEGVIPAGQYGGGEVIVWDRGTYVPDACLQDGKVTAGRAAQQKEIKAGLKAGKLAFTLFGKKLGGSWTLVRTKRSEKDWLLIKHTDEFVDTEVDITENGKSVLSGKTIANLEKINPDKKKAMPEKRTTKKITARKATVVKPMLASLSASPFTREGWIYEPKFDGIRAIAYISSGSVNLQSRNGISLNHRFPNLVKSLSKNPDMVIDGEIVALDDQGRPSFQLLQARALKSKEASSARHIVYYVFDIPSLAGQSLMEESLTERKKKLKKNLKTTVDVKYVDDLHCDGLTAYSLCIKQGLEGIVAKREDATYQSGRRSPDWMKVRATQSAEFVICGYTKGTGSRENTFGSLIIGHYKNKKLLYAGGVGTGFDTKLLKQLFARLKSLVRKTSPFDYVIEDRPRGSIVWVEPTMVAEIKYAEWTADGRLRAPVFLRLREDVTPAETGPRKKAFAGTVATAENLKSAGDSLKLEVDGHTIAFSHLDKVLWPGLKGKGLTKRDYANYLLQVAPFILPHLKNRPLTLVRFPNGVHGQRFFQKHWEQNRPDFVETFEHFSENADENHQFLLCNNLATLIWLAQIADLELHTSHARIGAAAENKKLTQTYTDSLERIERSTLNYPDYLVLDLDPYIYSGKEAKGEEPALNRKGFRKVCKLARALKEMLDGMGMDAFVKTSGRTGLHIYVPIVRNVDYDQVRAIAQTIGKHLMDEHPRDVTMDWAVVKRTGKIFFDHNMNARGKTLASIYSPRMSVTATVSVPLDWDELDDVYPEQFTIKTVPERLAEVGDLWKDILDHKADVKKILGRK
ncbi:MAG: DNA ligase D [Cyanobacteria bacterium SZAS TMP-1]|nr:DNA ligase D [Cyanobacteria bacterium SZAS TMP-1]